MIQDLLPPEVICVSTTSNNPCASLFLEEANQLAGAVDKRKREFATARECARHALLKLGVAPCPILRGLKGDPIWPRDVIGSITHCPGYFAAAVTKQRDIRALGIDAEIHDELPHGVLEQVAVPEERNWLAQAPEDVHWDRILFSAKESVYKAWFPLTEKWLDFERVIVTFNLAEGTFNARLPVELSVRDLPTHFVGRFQVKGGLVFTAIALRKDRFDQTTLD